MISYYGNLTGIQFSDMYLEYVNRLNIHRPIDAYMEVPEGVQDNNNVMGWAFIPERKVYIRPTIIQHEVELRLAHEITHVVLADQGYRMLSCYEDDLCIALANLLHHMVLYPRLVEGGFTLDQDRVLVMCDLVNRFKDIRDGSITLGEDYKSYAKIIILNDLVRMSEDSHDEYLELVGQIVPELTEEALSLLQHFSERSAHISVDTYERVKTLLEQEFCEYFPWY